MEAKGYMGGVVRFDGQFVEIQRKGLNRLTVGKGVKRIHISQISAVQLKPAGALVNGFIEFTLPGGNERRSQFGSQTASAVNHENSVIFTRKQQPAFDALRQAVEEAIAHLHTPAGTQPADTSATDQLRQLAELRDAGIITPEEFEAKKAELLGRI